MWRKTVRKEARMPIKTNARTKEKEKENGDYNQKPKDVNGPSAT